MTNPGPIAGSSGYSHDLLLHDCDEDLVAATRAFVQLGLASGGQVLVHSSEERVDLLRGALGTHPRLSYGIDRDLYLSPSSTLFAYQQKLAAEPGEFWVTGTVPIGDDPAGHAAWMRYESMVNEVLGDYAFHALCTYDTRTLPAPTVAAVRAVHPGLSCGGDRTATSADYLDPAAFLAHPLAGLPDPPEVQPLVVEQLHSVQDLRRVRHLLSSAAESASAVSRYAVEGLIAATHEVLINALQHGEPPVELVMWADTSRLVCRVTDAGPGTPDTLAGYRRPEGRGPSGLWVARRLCEDVIISNHPDGCRVFLATP